jgi:hypothetical protein
MTGLSNKLLRLHGCVASLLHCILDIYYLCKQLIKQCEFLNAEITQVLSSVNKRLSNIYDQPLKEIYLSLIKPEVCNLHNLCNLYASGMVGKKKQLLNK